jgi:PAS domain S-box-containing protein
VSERLTAAAIVLAALASLGAAWNGRLELAAGGALSGLALGLGWQLALRQRPGAASGPPLEAIARHHPELVEPGRDLALRWGLDGRLHWIDEHGLERLGLERDKLAGLRLEELFEQRSAERLRAWLATQAAGRAARGPLELLLHPRGQPPFWASLHMRRVAAVDGSPLLEGVARDVSAQRILQTISAIQIGMGSSLADGAGSDAALRAILRTLCRELDRDYAEFWRLDGGGLALQCIATWHARASDRGHCAEAARGASIARSEGLVGQVWCEGTPRQQALDPQDEAAARLTAASLREALALPVRLLGRVVGVVLLASGDAARREWIPLQALDALGSELGRVIERLRSQDTLRNRESRRDNAVEATLDCVITIDRRGNVLEFNAAAERTFGYRRPAVLGRPIASLIVPPELRERYERALGTCVHSGEMRLTGRRIEFEALREDGKRLLVELSVARVCVEPEPVFTAILRDISERKDLEKLKDELVSTVSHELRTPLASLRGFVELLLAREYPEAERRRFLTIIDEEIKRLTKLLNEFLDLQRFETAQQEHHVEDADLCALVAECVEVVRPSSSRHQFELDLPRAGLRVQVDVDRIKQALLNLFSNAVKYSPEGGPVQVRCRRVGGSAHVRVRDQGVGMSSATLERLFTKFFRADSSLTRSIGGTGLGLALVKSIADAHGGDVSVTSSLGAGSEFTLVLPLAGERRAEPAAVDAAPVA